MKLKKLKAFIETLEKNNIQNADEMEVRTQYTSAYENWEIYDLVVVDGEIMIKWKCD